MKNKARLVGKSLIFDIETNGLLPHVSALHCVCIQDIGDTSKSVYSFSTLGNYEDGSIEDALEILQSAKVLIGHNIILYDIPVLKHLFPRLKTWKPSCIDTQIWSRLCFPDVDDSDYEYQTGDKDTWESLHESKLVGSHSLKSWGIRLECHKGDYGSSMENPWAEVSAEMVDYCAQDIVTTRALLDHLRKQEFSGTALRMELDFVDIMRRQMRYGWAFNEDKAWHLYARLQDERNGLLVQLQNIFPSWLAPDKIMYPKRDNKKTGAKAGCPYTKLKTVDFNPNSNQQIVYWLKRRHRWKPTDFTDPTPSYPNGQPKVNEEILKGMKYPEAPLLMRYLMLNKRISQLAEGKQAWLKRLGTKNPWDQSPVRRLYGKVLTTGCVTRRCSHSGPNLAQVPNLDAPFGPECRDLFVAPPGRTLVGFDSSALEARVQAHYQAPYDEGALITTVVAGKKEDKTSLHFVNQRAFEADSYADAKTGYYALLYGAGDEKLGRTFTHCNDTEANRRRGRQARKNFERNQPGYARLKALVSQVYREKGYLLSIDKHPLKVRSEHSSLNTLFQSAGAILMKLTTVLLDRRLTDLGLTNSDTCVPGTCPDYEFLGNIHDENQIETTGALADLIGLMAQAAHRDAGVLLGCRCPLDTEYSVGNSWKETH